MKRSWMAVLGVLVVACAAAALAGCVSPTAAAAQEVAPEVVESAALYKKVYILGPGDEVDVLVRGNPDVSRPCLIRPDGYISLPLLGDVQAAKLTVAQLDEALTSRFSPRLVEPEVTVIATKVREPMVYVVGEVNRPQPVPLRLAGTAAQAIAYAGDIKPSGTRDSIALIRLNRDGRLQAFILPLKVEGQPAPYMALQAAALEADDILLVPETNIAQVDRWISNYINQPLQGVNSILSPTLNYLLIEDFIDDNND